MITTRIDYSIPMGKAQIASLPYGLVAAAEVLLFIAFYGTAPVAEAADMLMPWLFLPVFAAGIIAHELIHGFTWMFAARLPFAKMKFGFQWKSLTPYAHCTVPIRKDAYILGTLMPAVVLGFVPFLGSLINGNGWLLMFGVLFTFAAVGDFLIIRMIRSVRSDALVADHPEQAGCYVYEIEE